MFLSLININLSKVRAEEDATQENNVLKLDSNDQVYHISDLVSFNAFFNREDIPEDAVAVLENDIVIDNSAEYTTYTLNVYGNRIIDMNGHDIIVNKTMVFKPTSTSKQYDVQIINGSRKDSTIRPKLNADIYALMIVLQDENTKGINFGINSNGDGNRIIFDGLNKPNMTGLVLGLGLQNQTNIDGVNVSYVNNVLFKNFMPLYGDAIALVDIGTVLFASNIEITNSQVGLAAGAFNFDFSNGTNPDLVLLSNVLIHNCETGILNGLNTSFGEKLFINIGPASIITANTKIEYNHTGIELDYPSIYHSNDSILDYALGFEKGTEINANYINVNLVNFEQFAIGGPIIAIGNVKEEENADSKTSGISVGIHIDGKIQENVQDGGLPVVLLGSNASLLDIYLENSNYLLAFSGEESKDKKELSDFSTNRIGYVINPGETGFGIAIPSSSTNIKKGERVMLSAIVGKYAEKGEVMVLGPDGKVYDEDELFIFIDPENTTNAPSTRRVHVSFAPKKSGTYRLVYTAAPFGGDTVIFSNPITVVVDESSDPVVETCENKFGPTWHWNNKKGICEDTGVVNTYTR